MSERQKLQTRAFELWALTCGVRWECYSKTCAARNCTGRKKRAKTKSDCQLTKVFLRNEATMFLCLHRIRY